MSSACPGTVSSRWWNYPRSACPRTPPRDRSTPRWKRRPTPFAPSSPPSASLVALCVEGKLRSSEEVARLLADWSQNSAKHLVFLIGGSYGLHPSIKAQAWVKLSMSPMTFPHHLARVMLLEQIYRGFKINEGSSYHK